MPGAITGDIGKEIAFAHTIFNVIIVLLFLPVTGLLCKLLIKLIPNRIEKEVPHLTYLDAGLAETPSIAIQESGNAILKMRDGVDKMMIWMGSELENPGYDHQQRRKLLHREEILDVMQKEVVEFISRIMQKNLPFNVITEGRQQLRIADEYESISDYIITLLKLNDRLTNLHSSDSEKDLLNIRMLHEKVSHYLTTIGAALATGNADILTKANSEGGQITNFAKQCREEHLNRIEHAGTTPQQTLVIIDMLQSYRKIRAHALNIAETVAGEK